mgnify:CR=1 FL=1
MISLLHPATLGALVIGALFIFVLVVTAASDTYLALNDRREQVVANFAGLRLTVDHVILGAGKDARRIPLAGLTVDVTQTESDDGASVLVTVAGAGHTIRRHEPLSYGASGEAAAFAVLFNMMTRSPKQAVAAHPLAA